MASGVTAAADSAGIATAVTLAARQRDEIPPGLSVQACRYLSIPVAGTG